MVSASGRSLSFERVRPVGLRPNSGGQVEESEMSPSGIETFKFIPLEAFIDSPVFHLCRLIVEKLMWSGLE
jgi:hypothetical protein